MTNQGRTAPAKEQSGSGDAEPVDLSEDLVCGLLVGPGSTTERVRHEGQDYYFCSPSCAEEFRSDPSAYIKPAKDEVSSAFAMLDSDDDNDESRSLSQMRHGRGASHVCP
jgi:YHS domain-containing protein